MRALSSIIILITFGISGWAIAGEGAGDVGMIQGKWLLRAVNGAPVESEQPAYFSVSGNEFSGFDGCNFFGGMLDNPISLRMTQRACPDEHLAFDAGALAAKLPAATTQDDTLTIVLDENGMTLQFSPES